MKDLMNGFLITALTISCLEAQSLTGNVTAADTGATIAGASVVAVQKPTSPGQQPTIFKAVTDENGFYAISAPPAQYALCVHTMLRSLYLDPCQWGSPAQVTIGASAAASAAPQVVPLALQKGARFIVRVHDRKQVLSQAETLAGIAVSAFVSSASVKQFPLPMIYSDGNVRDYGTVVPINIPMSVTITSNAVALADSTGAPLSRSAMPLQVFPTDIEVTGAPPSPVTRMFPPSDAKMIHVYTTGLR